MTKRTFYLICGYLLAFILANSSASASRKITITTSPQTARIYVNGQLVGPGKIVVTIPKKDCLLIEVKSEGFIQETRTYCNKSGAPEPPNNEYIQLQQDEAYTSTQSSDWVNKDFPIFVKPGRTREEAWVVIVKTVMASDFDLENNDEHAGYLRTMWIGNSYKSNTLRTRLVIKQSSDDPLAYKIKLQSEESGKPASSFTADELYHPFNRIPKRFGEFLEELSARLKN